MKFLRRLYCWLDGFHFTRRTVRVVNNEGQIFMRTKVRCFCGLVDAEVTGLISRAEADRIGRSPV